MSNKIKQYWDYFIHRVLRIPITMAVRYDFSRSLKPELTIIFLHGIAASFTGWRPTVKELAADKELSKVRFIGLDLIGFGKSERPSFFKYDYESYRKALKHTIKKLKIKTPIILAGHSMGCLIAVDFAEHTDYDIAELVLVSPPFMRQNESANIFDRLHNRAFKDIRNNTDAPIIEAIAKFVDAVSSFEKYQLNTPAFHYSMDRIILNPENWRRAMDIKLDCEVIHGRVDPLVIGGNLRAIEKRNSHFHLQETFGGHDIVGLKQKRVIQKIKAVALKHLLAAK